MFCPVPGLLIFRTSLKLTGSICSQNICLVLNVFCFQEKILDGFRSFSADRAKSVHELRSRYWPFFNKFQTDRWNLSQDYVKIFALKNSDRKKDRRTFVCPMVGRFIDPRILVAVVASQRTFLLPPAPIQGNTRGGDQKMQEIGYW